MHVIALDFSKAFDRVRHATLADKLAALDIPDMVYNWILEYLSNRKHCTKVASQISTLLKINCSIVQGSGIGPSCYVINSSDLQPGNKENFFKTYADDTYLIVTPDNTNTIRSEMDQISRWALENNLVLN